MTKDQVRKDIIAKRLRLSDNEHSHLSHEINRQLLYLIPKETRYVHTFLPSIPKGEPNLWPLIRIALHRGVKLCVPIVKGKSDMDSAIFTDGTELKEQSFGVLEPKSPQLINEEEIDVVLVPLIAFDSKGYRVGYGGGYYDRFLKRLPNALKIGVSLFPAIEKITDIHEDDIPLDICVTPDGQHQWKR